MRSEFSSSVRNAAWKRCKGLCEGCGIKLFPGNFDYDHDKPDGLAGKPTLENCKVLCKNCHHTKTVEIDRPIMQKADNIRAKHFGLGEKKRPWPKRPKRCTECNKNWADSPSRICVGCAAYHEHTGHI